MDKRPRSIIILALLAIALGSPASAQVAPSAQQVSVESQPSTVLAAPSVARDGASENAAAPPEMKTAALIAAPPPEIRRRDTLPDPVVAKPAQSPSPTPGQILFNRTRDASVMDPISWNVVINKSRHELTVYYKGRFYQTYQAVFGRNLDNGAKAYEEDRRTPEGVYTIIKEFPSRRFHWFLRLNYPNLIDRERYQEMRADGVVPVEDDGWTPGVGGAIGIHGTDVPSLNEGLINWTTGCISVENRSIDELHRLLPVGTVVIIKP